MHPWSECERIYPGSKAILLYQTCGPSCLEFPVAPTKLPKSAQHLSQINAKSYVIECDRRMQSTDAMRCHSDTLDALHLVASDTADTAQCAVSILIEENGIVYNDFVQRQAFRRRPE